MSQPLTEIEKRIAAVMLEAASNKFANHGCNDVFLKDRDFYGEKLPEMTPEERRELLISMERWNGDKEELARLEALPVGDSEFDYTSDFYMMSYMAARLTGKA